MKTTNFKFSIFVFVLTGLFFNLNAYAEDVPLKKDGGPIVSPNVLSPMKSLSLNSFTYMSVSADLTNGELTVDFGTPVGTAVVSIVDASGAVVYQVVVDTYNTPEVVIPVDNLSTGNYNLKISYGSTNLIGGFQL
jgi:hypothetical protein